MAGKIHGGTIQAELTADVSGYMSGLGQATQASQQFQRSVTGISFQGFNRGIIATTTLLYGMNRIMSQMSQGMEEFSNVLARIGTVADLTAESVRHLADSMKSVSVSQGVVRSDIMKAMYTTAQSRFTKPSEMRFFGEQSAMLSRASGKEIDAMGAAKLMTGLVRSLGLDVQKDVASGKLSDMLLKSRDIGRWELREMAPAIAKVATVFGNEFADRLGGIETLRQMNAIMAVASGTDLPLGMVSTGVRRLVERSYQLRGSGRGDYLRSQLAGLGYDPKDPITAALEKGPLFYLRDLAKLSGGSPMELYKLGFQSRELAAVSAAMSGKGSQLMSAYQQTAPGSISGLTGQYSDKMKNTYEFRRDQLRAEWQITAQEFMQASIPLIGSFTTALSGLNKVAQMLPDSVKSFMGLIAMVTSLRFALNLLGFKGSIFGISSNRMTGGGDRWKLGGKSMTSMGGAASMMSQAMGPFVPSVQEQVFGRISDAIRRNSTLGAPVEASKQGTEGFFGRTYNSIASSLKQRYMAYNQIGINPFSGKYQARGARGRFLPTSDTLQDALIARTNSFPLDNFPYVSMKKAVLGIGSLPQQLARMHGVRTSLAAQGRFPYLARELDAQGIGALLTSFYGMSALPFDLLRYGAQRVMGATPTLPKPGKNNIFRQVGQSARVGLASPISLPSSKWVDPHGFTSYEKLNEANRLVPMSRAEEMMLRGTNLPMPPRGVNTMDLGRRYGTVKPQITTQFLPSTPYWNARVESYFTPWQSNSVNALLERAKAAGDKGIVAQLRRYGTSGYGPRVPFGPSWYDTPRTEPMNAIQARAQAGMQARLDAQRAASNAMYWVPGTNERRHGWSSKPYSPTVEESIARKQAERNARIYERYKSDNFSMSGKELYDLNYQTEPGMPTTRERLVREAARRGEVIDFEEGTYRPRRLSDKPASFIEQMGRYRGLREGSGRVGYAPTAKDYSAAGIGKFAQAAGRATAGIGKFASGLAGLVAPMATMAIVMHGLNSFISGMTSKGKNQKISGLEKISPDRYSWSGKLWDWFGAASKHTGAAWVNDKETMYSSLTDHARKYGYIIDPDSPDALGAWGAFWKFRSPELKGLRQAKTSDVLSEVWREELSDAQRSSLIDYGGVNPSMFDEKTKSILDKHLRDLGLQAPDSWDDMLKGVDGIDRVRAYLADAYKKFAEELMSGERTEFKGLGVRDALGDIIRGGRLTKEQRRGIYTSGFLKAGRLDESMLGSYAEKWMGSAGVAKDIQYKDGAWRSPTGNKEDYARMSRVIAGAINMLLRDKGISAKDDTWGVPGGTMDMGSKTFAQTLDDIAPHNIGRINRSIRDMMLGERQMSIYGLRDKVYGGGGGLNWSQKYKDLYGEAISDVHRDFGGFGATKESMARLARESRNLPKLVAEESHFVTDTSDVVKDTLGRITDRRHPQYEKMHRLSNFLSFIPNLATMGDKEAEEAFLLSTGRRKGKDDYYETDLDAFRKMDVSSFLDVVTKGSGKLAAATTFGTSEAYNQIVGQGHGPEEKMVANLDRIAEALDRFTVEQSDVDKERDGLFEKVKTFLEKQWADYIAAGTQFFAQEIDEQ